MNPQAFKSGKIITLKGQNTVSVKCSNSRRNVTVSATVSDAGVCMPPLIIFEAKKYNPVDCKCLALRDIRKR